MVNLLRCLINAELSYHSINNWDIKNVVYKEFQKNLLNIVHLYYYYEEDELYISIRGSDCIFDLLDDIDIYKVIFKEIKEDNMYLHNGFYTDFCEIKEYVEDIIKSKPVKTIYFTGHSKGAAIATITSIYFGTIYNNIKIYNIGFGCPRVGCKKFVNYYNNKLSSTTFLIRTKKDLITQLPIYDYYDILNQYIIDNNKLISFIPEDNISNILFSSINYHKLKYYKECNYEIDNEIDNKTVNIDEIDNKTVNIDEIDNKIVNIDEIDFELV
jgi:hypothetical protein